MTGEEAPRGRPSIEVWAPAAARVELVWSLAGRETLDAHRDPLERTGGGWWRWEAPDAWQDDDPMERSGRSSARRPGPGPAPALDYAFVLDGAEPPLPDPRSAWQPFGVHGPSRTFDPGAFTWTDRGWPGACNGAGALGAAFYELHVGTFTPQGTLDAAAGRLADLADLGIDIVELMPVMAFDGDRGWGYDGVAPFSVHAAYGGPAALQRFVDAAHARGIAVCLDVVHNHLGPSGNYLSRFGPYFTDTHETPWGSAVNLDAPGSGEVRRFLLESAVRWLRDFHVDALRLDAVHELRDDSKRHFLAELSDTVAGLAARLGRPLDLVAESDLNDVTMLAPTGVGGLGMDAQWDDDVHHALHVVLTGETEGYYADFAGGPGRAEENALDVLDTVFTTGFLHAGTYSSFRDAVWGRPIEHPERFDARRLLGYLQSHDQVGNRAVGDRVHHGMPPARHALGAALYLLGPFTPMVFMGEEWAASSPWQFFTSFEPDLGDLVRAGRRAEFGRHGWRAGDLPDPQDRATFERSRLSWDERAGAGHAEMLRWYAACLRLRRAHLAGPTRLTEVAVRHEAASGAVTMRHRDVVVAGVLGPAPARVALPPGEVALAWPAPDPPAAGEEGTAAAGLCGVSHDGGIELDPGQVVVLLAAPVTRP